MTAPLSEESVRSLLGIIQHMRKEQDLLEVRMRTALLEYLPQVGAIREDEEGWAQIVAIDWDVEQPGFWVTDKDGKERCLTVQQLGSDWRTP